VLVLLGVVGEVVFDWKEMAGKSGRGKKLSAILLIVGLLMEFREAAQSDIEVGEAKKKAGEAIYQAAQANVRAAKFDSDRVTIEKQAEEIRSTNFVLQARVLELEAKVHPRTITDTQREMLVKCFAIKPKGEVAVQSDFFDTEASTYAGRISDVLKSAAFVTTDLAQTGRVVFSLGQPGVFILVKDVNHAPFHARTIQDCFSEIGVSVLGKSVDWLTSPSNCVVIWVGN
jgi:hypothetical protein